MATSGYHWPTAGDVPAPGTVGLDTARSRIGEVMGDDAGRLLLRPVRGGREWLCPPESFRPAARAEGVPGVPGRGGGPVGTADWGAGR